MRKALKRLAGFFTATLFLAAAVAAIPASPSWAHEGLTIAAASDLSGALREIAFAFEAETGVKAVLSFGSTGMLARQIKEGAPFDVFLSADEGYVGDLNKGGFVMAESIRVYAYGRLAIVTSNASVMEIKDFNLMGLAQPGIKKIAIANPGHAPYGRATVEAMKKAGVWDGVKDKLVYGENVRHALQFVETGDAQAGIVAVSIANIEGVKVYPVDEGMHKPIVQTGAVLRGSKNVAIAGRFLDYLASSKGREVLLKYGFRLPPPAPSTKTKKD
ncbi:MAG: molybdate ABC transporter substrate-binding protein [Deltaproteobacteria bacterium]|nr:molybdate ABC transporter substrate-binding protein [Deltaproteobacteria bacterium]